MCPGEKPERRKLIAALNSHRGRSSESGAQNTKSRMLSFAEKQAAPASMKPPTSNALNALRDGTSCSERLW
jgi:hypothetical protein